MAESAESYRDGLNAIGNPERVFSSSDDGGMSSKGYIGQTHPTGILARGEADGALWRSRGGVAKGTERTPSRRKA